MGIKEERPWAWKGLTHTQISTPLISRPLVFLGTGIMPVPAGCDELCFQLTTSMPLPSTEHPQK